MAASDPTKPTLVKPATTDKPTLTAAKVDPPKRGVFRVNYYVAGQPVTAYVCAFSDSEASGWLGVRDGSASVSRVAWPVEVIGIDKVHDAIPVPEVFKAEPAPEPLTDAEIARIRRALAQQQAPAQPATGAKPTLTK